MKVKKILAMLLAGTLAISAAGCAGSGNTAAPSASEGAGAQNEKIKINSWHQWSNDTNELRQMYEKAVTDYMAANPNVTINSQALDTEAYKTKISAEFAGDAKGIDVFYYWGAGTASKLIKADKLLPLDTYVTDEVKGKMLEGSTTAFTYDGKLYSVPSFSWYMTLFCNKELFDKAGAALPETYDQLVEAVKKLSALDGVTPIASGAKDGWNAAFIYQALALREVGASEINAMLTGQKPFGDEGYTNAANKLVELYKLGAFGKNPLEMGNDDSDVAFNTGRAAMRIMGSWFANGIYTPNVNNTINPESIVALRIPVVEGKGNPADYCGGFIESFWVNKNTKYPDEAAKFAIYINEKMGVAAYESGVGFSGWKAPADESKLNPLFIQIKDLLGNSKEGVLAWDTSLNAEAATIHNEQVQTLFAPNADVSAFIQENEQAINK